MKTKNNFKEGDLVVPRSFRLFDTGLNENSLGRVMFDENNLLHVR